MFNPAKGTNQILTAGVASLSTPINSVARAVRIVNAGANVGHVRIGPGVVTATLNDTPIYPGASVILKKGDGEGTLAYVTGAGATTLHVQTGEAE